MSKKDKKLFGAPEKDSSNEVLNVQNEENKSTIESNEDSNKDSNKKKYVATEDFSCWINRSVAVKKGQVFPDAKEHFIKALIRAGKLKKREV